MKMTLGTLCFLAFVQTACFASLGIRSTSTSEQVPNVNTRIDYLRSQLAEKERAIQSLKEQNMILRQISGQEDQFNEKDFVQNEVDLYQLIFEAYQGSQVERLEQLNKVYASKFPKSPKADNALFLLGLAQFEKGQLTPALQTMDLLIQNYPRGNKRVSALYVKSAIYKKLNLVDQSMMILESVLKKYPGSLEAQRAQLDMRLFKENS